MSKPALAFDLGTTTGWAAQTKTGMVECGYLNLRPGRFEGGGFRYLRFEKAVRDLIAVVKPEAVFFEEVRRHMGVDAAHVYGGLMATLTKVLDEQSIPYSGIPVGTIKKVATGRGDAKKHIMIAAARARWPQLTIPDDNVADALWCLQAGLNTLS